MSNVKRWVDDGAPAGIRRLFTAAREEKHDESGVQRTLLAVGVGGAAATGASHAGALGAAKVANASLFGMAVKWGTVGAACAVATMGAVHAFEPSAPAGSPKAAVAASAPSTHGAAPGAAPAPVPADIANTNAEAVAGPAPAAVPVNDTRSASSTGSVAGQSTNAGAKDALHPAPSEATSAPAVAAPRALVEPASAVGNVAPRSTPPRSAAAGDVAARDARDSSRMLEEVHAIDAARAALSSGNGARTIALVDAYRAAFPDGRFAPEALYLQMQALLQVGDTASARVAAQKLLAQFPNSPQAARAHLVASGGQ